MSFPNLDACKIQGVEGVYLVGGLSRRVNVSSQQSRAFSAVLELDEKLRAEGKSLNGSRVAVVGAGACGLMAAATSGYLKAQVYLFDKNGMLGGAHKDSKHRFLHPNFNDWPHQEEIPVSNLPFMNWVSDTGESVANQLLNDWGNITTELKGNINVPFHRAQLSSIDGTENSWDLTFRPKRKELLPHFEYVFLCLGFGEDAKKYLRRVGPSYWDTNSHRDYYRLVGNEFRGQGLQDPETRLFVFGNADGGINECLQFIYRDFLPGDPQPRLLGFLKDTSLAQSLRDVEQKADEDLKAISLLDRSKRKNAEKELGEEVWWKYVELVKHLEALPLYQECFGPMNRHPLSTACLFGMTPTPFDINATAINRAMLCFSVLSGAVSYYRLDEATEGRGSRGHHTVVGFTSTSGWTVKKRLRKQELKVGRNDFRTARFGPSDIYAGITINGVPIDTGEERRNLIRLTEPAAKRRREEFGAPLEEKHSMFSGNQVGSTYAELFTEVLAKRFKRGFEKLYLHTPEAQDKTDAIYILNFRFSGAVKLEERAEWKAALPTTIFGRKVDLNDLDAGTRAELLD